MSSKKNEFFRFTGGYRIVLWYSSVFAICILGLLGGFYFCLVRHLEKKDQADLARITKELAAAYDKGGISILREKAVPSLRIYVIRLASSGHPPVYLNEAEAWEKVDQGDLDGHLSLPFQGWVQKGFREEEKEKEQEHPFEFCSLRLKDGWFLQVGHNTEERQELLESYRTIFQIAVIPIILIWMLMGFLLAYNRILNPVRHLSRTLETILEGDLSARVPEGPAGDELGRLTRLFNRMLNRIETLLTGMKQSTDNVAHDLRTPLTRLKMTVESALQRETSLEVSQKALADCAEEADRILSILNLLMDISEVENGVMKLTKGPVSISSLFQEAAELYQHVADEKNIQLVREAPPGLIVLGDKGRLLQVLANLLDNAIKYTPRGGKVELHSEGQGNLAFIRVKDNGVGISPEDLPRIWERLYRGDRSRSQRGMGLGLSLVKAVVDAHGGRVSVESAPGRGAVFTLELAAKLSNL